MTTHNTPDKQGEAPKPQSKAYQEAAAVEARLRSIASEHSRTLELMNWKLSSHASVPAVEGDAAFTEDPPTKQGWYWHWNGDKDCAPVPISVLIHGAGDRKCFVSMGQLGLTRAIECDEYGGWWMPLLPPSTAAASSPAPAEKLTPLQHAMVEHGDDMARLDRNTLPAEPPCPFEPGSENYWPAEGEQKTIKTHLGDLPLSLIDEIYERRLTIYKGFEYRSDPGIAGNMKTDLDYLMAFAIALKPRPAATPPTSPSDAAMRAARNAVEELKREYLLAETAPEELNEIAAIITRHLAAPTVAGLPTCPKCQQGYICEHCGSPIGDYYATQFAAATTSPETPNPRICVKCNHVKLDPWRGYCKHETSAFGKRPITYCGCKCEFPSPETPVKGEARTCSKCGHENRVDSRGRCIAVYRDAGGSLVYCDCKCEFPAPVVATADNEGEPWCESCQSYHPAPRDAAHKSALGCAAALRTQEGEGN